MSTHPYAKLLVCMYAFPKAETQKIAAMLSDEDIATIESAIATLLESRNGKLRRSVVYKSFGIGYKAMSFSAIGKSLNRPVSGSFIGDVRSHAMLRMRRVSSLRPLVERITKAGIEGARTKETLKLLTSAELERLKRSSHQSDPGALADMDWQNVPIDALNLSIRVRNCLINGDVSTLGELCEKSEADLLWIKNFGEQSLEEVNNFLATIGRRIRA